ncbi:19990_t:CDS:2, partial [Gigaspora rosea]
MQGAITMLDILKEQVKRTDDKVKRTASTNPRLFSALLLKEAGIKDVTILESSDRVGGRVYTTYFTDDPNDDKRLYGELGANRFPIVVGHPELSQQQLVYDTITYLNEYNKVDNPDNANGSIITKSVAFGGAKPVDLGYPDTIPEKFLEMWDDALAPFFNLLDKNFTNGIEALKHYDKYSAYTYLKEIYFPSKLPQSMAPYDEVMKAIEMNVLGT